jgi:DNA-binding transcriptional LysR family regulator
MHAAILRYFDQVVRYGSIRKAAESLNVASSAVNRQILKLEDELGTPLFERSRNGVKLTPAGDILLRHVHETMRNFGRTRDEIASLGGQVIGNVHILALESLMVGLVPNVVKSVATKHPGITFSAIGRDTADITTELRAGRTDIGLLFIDRRLRDIEVVAEFPVTFGAVMTPKHPLAKRQYLNVADCAAYPVVMPDYKSMLEPVIESEFPHSGASFDCRAISNSFPFMGNILRAGLGIGFFSPIGFLDDLKAGRLVHVPFKDPLLARTAIGAVVLRNRPLPAAATIVLDHIRHHFQKLSQELNRLPGQARKRKRG